MCTQPSRRGTGDALPDGADPADTRWCSAVVLGAAVPGAGAETPNVFLCKAFGPLLLQTGSPRRGRGPCAGQDGRSCILLLRRDVCTDSAPAAGKREVPQQHSSRLEPFPLPINRWSLHPSSAELCSKLKPSPSKNFSVNGWSGRCSLA